MARPQAFDTQEVLTSAMNTFWKQGYNNTSINDLETHTGISRISLYNTFDSKEGLFLAAVDLYIATARQRMNKMFENKTIEEFITFFSTISSKDNTSFGALYGCMMVNTVLDIPDASDEIKEKVREYRNIFKSKAVEVLENNSDKLINPNDIEEKAELLTATLWGILVTNRLYHGTIQSNLMANQIIKTIESWVK